MSIVNAIYNAPIVRQAYCDIEGTTHVIIKYNGKYYGGWAQASKEDIDFFSKKVGKNIALSRARLKAMKAELQRETMEYNIKGNFYLQITNITTASLRPLRILKRNKWRCESLREAIRREENNLTKYIEGQDRAIQSVKKMREKAKTD